MAKIFKKTFILLLILFIFISNDYSNVKAVVRIETDTAPEDDRTPNDVTGTWYTRAGSYFNTSINTLDWAETDIKISDEEITGEAHLIKYYNNDLDHWKKCTWAQVSDYCL